MASCWLTAGLVMLVLAFLASVVSFVVPYWVEHSKDHTVGIMAVRHKSDWKWYMGDIENLEKKLPDWFKATQALFALGVVSLLISILLAFCNICRKCCQEFVHLGNIACGLLILAFLELGIAVALFGAKMNKDQNVKFDGQPKFSWGYYLGMVAAVLSLLTAITYICEGCQARRRGYTRGKIV